jgi:CheY-like chemotaxis protein
MKKPTILLVEDEESDVYLLTHAFREAGIVNEVVVARTGQEALDFFTGTGRYSNRRAFPLPGLVLLDLNLPIKSGMEVLEWMRRQPSLRVIAVIVFTSSCHPMDIERAYELGANCVVTKPQDLEALEKLAVHLKGWWLTFTQLPPMVEESISVVQRSNGGNR